MAHSGSSADKCTKTPANVFVLYVIQFMVELLSSCQEMPEEFIISYASVNMMPGLRNLAFSYQFKKKDHFYLF